MAAGHSAEATTLTDDNACWGDLWLPDVLEAIGGFEGSAKVYSIHLRAEYGTFATATIKFGCGSEIVRVLPHFGTNWLSAALNAPRGLQAIAVDIEEKSFVIVYCRYAPIDTPLGAVVAALKVSEDAAT